MALSDNIIAYYKFNEASWNGTPGEIIESSGESTNGQGSGNATTGAGKLNNAGIFDGTANTYAMLGALPYTTAFSMSFWLYITARSTGGIIFDDIIGGGGSIEIQEQTDGT